MSCTSHAPRALPHIISVYVLSHRTLTSLMITFCSLALLPYIIHLLCRCSSVFFGSDECNHHSSINVCAVCVPGESWIFKVTLLSQVVDCVAAIICYEIPPAAPRSGRKRVKRCEAALQRRCEVLACFTSRGSERDSTLTRLSESDLRP